MYYLNIIAIIAFMIISHSFVAGIFRKEYLISRKKAFLNFISLIYLGGYGVILHISIAYYSYGNVETLKDIMCLLVKR